MEPGHQDYYSADELDEGGKSARQEGSCLMDLSIGGCLDIRDLLAGDLWTVNFELGGCSINNLSGNESHAITILLFPLL